MLHFVALTVRAGVPPGPGIRRVVPGSQPMEEHEEQQAHWEKTFPG